ncbi:signal peptide peptidase SppA [Candidatus Woesearchaeota archaeon CG11_big_fil_rev_8_21_14_0_20_43_8]|nr:MAG: signal peptide peptidase SppA [Candidatus Woesearchaeota archaeon CG11_big_fil_rev_8_21_14_0_20_43_8]PIO06375.1 MAG: signal peptide peptidase SppA [Candidatus Woesearchaeota archaeon CG08_land_8_20_14_0_20_43_7]
MEDRWKTLIFIVAGLWLLSLVISYAFSFMWGDVAAGNIAIIDLHGVISVDGGSLFDQGSVSSDDMIQLIEEADKNEDVKGIIIDINSPGGSAVASEEIARAIKEANKTTVALIREIGTSGALWVASATDQVVASPLSMTGSIGVISSYLEFSGLMQDYNVSYERLVAGQYKDMGSPYRQLTYEERKLFQDMLDETHRYFIEAVANNRNLDIEKLKENANGMIFSGTKAKEIGLVDTLGGKREAVKFLETKYNITAETVRYEKRKGFFEMLSGVLSKSSFYVGKGISSSLEQDATPKILV